MFVSPDFMGGYPAPVGGMGMPGMPGVPGMGEPAFSGGSYDSMIAQAYDEEDGEYDSTAGIAGAVGEAGKKAAKAAAEAEDSGSDEDYDEDYDEEYYEEYDEADYEY
jgi:hypothetical protein